MKNRWDKKGFRFVFDKCLECGCHRVVALNKGQSDYYKKRCRACGGRKIDRSPYRAPAGMIAVDG